MTSRIRIILALLATALVGPVGLPQAPATAAASVVSTIDAASAPAAADPSVVFTGHGYGHGRGLGQWGSLGYALAGWGYQQILDHFYGGTWLANPGYQQITVRLLAADGQDTIVHSPNGGIQVAGYGAVSGNSVLVRRTGSGQFAVFTSSSCGGPWGQPITTMSTTSVVIGSLLSPSSVDNLLQRCEVGRTRSYRGELLAVDTGSSQATVNRLPMEDYLRGVVPQESPASWADRGAGKGAEALKAQAVAARSYALAENRFSFAKTCDTTSCQVYGGAAVNPSGGARQMVEDPRTDAAVAATAGFVRKFLDRDQVARTEFSSSTGGHTAPGTFPAVPDDGDAVSPYHDWTATFTPEAISSALGLGTVTNLTVTQRNGYGAEGGRVLLVDVETTNGVRSVTGATIRDALGLRSTWFSVTWEAAPPVGPAGGYRLLADGSLSPFGAAPATSVQVPTGTGRAVAVGGPARTAGYVLAAGGDLTAFNGAPGVTDEMTWPFDAARDVELRADGTSGYVLDMNGGVWRFGGAPPPVPGISLYRNDATARALVLRPDGVSGFVAFADGAIGSFGGAPSVGPVVLTAGREVVGAILAADGNRVVLIDDGGGLIRSDGTVLRGGGPTGSVTGGDDRPDGSGYLVGIDSTVTAVLGAPTISASAGPSAVDVTLVAEPDGYVVDFAGGLHPFGGAPAATGSAYFGGWDIVRGVAVGRGGAGVVLDGWGGLHPFGSTRAQAPSGTASSAYWPGWDIARGVVLLPDASGGYVLDGWGGLHPFGTAPAVSGGPYWPGWDIARGVALLPDGSGGYVLDGWGGVHPFAVGGGPAPPPASDATYFGSDIARGLAVVAAAQGAVVDVQGRVHGFGSPARSQPSAPAAAVALTSDFATGWMLWAASTGELTSVGATPSTAPSARWGFSAARGAAMIPR